MTPDEKRDYYSQAGRSLPAGTRYRCFGGTATAMEPLQWEDGWWGGRVRRPNGAENCGAPSGMMIDWDSVPSPDGVEPAFTMGTCDKHSLKVSYLSAHGCPLCQAAAHEAGSAQKYHHGPCNAHCRCGKVTPKHRCSACNLECEPGDLYTDGTKVFCSESCRDFGKVTKPARRFCACGQELMGARLEFAYLSPVCGDCAASKGPGAPSLDTRIAAARAVTDEAEGAWSTATSEGP